MGKKSKRAKLTQFNQLNPSFLKDDHSIKMRGSEQEAHFSRSFLRFEGGGEADQIAELDADEMELEDSEFQDEAMMGRGGMMEAGGGEGVAETLMMKLIISKESVFRIEGLDLQSIAFLDGQTWHTLQEVYLSKNMVSDIDILSDYQSITKIDASNNYLEQVTLTLPKLDFLNLMNNYIKKFPNLPDSPKLKYLNLNSNQIATLDDVTPEANLHIRHLDLGSNQIAVEYENQWKDIIAIVRQWNFLQHLILEDNPCFMPENVEAFYQVGINMKEDVLKNFHNLETLDGVDVQTISDQIAARAANIAQIEGQEQAQQPEEQPMPQAESEVIEAPQDFGIKQAQAPMPVVKPRKRKPPKSLEALLKNLEAANSHPSYSLDHLKDLAEDVDTVIEKIDMLEQSFAPGKDDAEIEEMIETFMQNSLLLIDNHYELQSILLLILAKLSIIKFQSFGLKCFTTLKDLMKSGRDMEVKVQEVLRTEVINKMRQQDPTQIPVSLLIGLYELVEDTENTDMLGGMYEMCFPVWLQSYCVKLDQCKAQRILMGNDDHYDAIISLVSVSVKDNEDNVERVLDKNLTDYIIKIIQSSNWEHERYIPCLNLIARLSNSKEELAELFMEGLVHKILLDQIKKSLKNYKKFNSLFDESSKETVDQQMLKYQTLAAEITTLGGLLLSKTQNRLLILNDPVVVDLIAIMGHQKTDPILLTAVCTFALDLFECPQLRYNAEFMNPFHQKMADMKYLIPYLGFGMYPDLLEMTRRYHSISNPTQKVTDSGSPEEQGITHVMNNQQNSTIDEEGAEEAFQAQIKQSLSHLDDPIVNELFISIIHLMKYFCLEAEQNQKNKLFDAISQSLNDNHREDALFNCLSIPDDNVRLAVVECLFVVPLDELEIGEIAQITKVMSTCNNIGAGQTELVLSTIYWICGKLVLGDPEELDSSKIFQTKFGEKTVNEALNILMRNLVRTSDQDDEDVEKYALSLSILNFIKASSIAGLMQKYLRGKNQVFRQILLNEELYSSDRVCKVPIDIENSLIGREMNCLIETISGVESIQPYCDVSLRVLIRMADVLMFRHECKVYEISESDDVIEELMKFQERIYKKKKIQEIDYWVDVPSSFLDQLTDEDRLELVNQHYNFTQSNGVALLKLFLTSKFPINEDLLKKLCDPCFDETQQFQADGKAKGLGSEIYEKNGILEQKFNAKYNKDYYSIRKVFYHKKMKEEGPATQQPQDATSEDLLDQEQNNLAFENCREASQYKYRQGMQFEELGIDYLDTLMDNQVGPKKEEIEQILVEKKMEEQKRQLNDPNGSSMSLKEKRGDGFLNRNIRVLTISAFLRCLYGAIEYAPTVSLKQDAIANIRDPLMFRSITQLCDSLNWDETANIGAKYLRVMRHVIKMPIEKEYEQTDMLMHYELIAMVIQKALSKIVDKMKKDIQLTDGDQVAIYEISLTFFTVIQQCNNFQFSKLDLVKQHRINEFFINLQQRILSGQVKFDKKIKAPPWMEMMEPEVTDKYKCEFETHTYKDKMNEKNFQVDMPLLRQRRTVQAKIVEFMVLKMFSRQSIFSLVDILFKDMNEDYKAIESDDSEEDEDEEEEEQKPEAEKDAEADGTPEEGDEEEEEDEEEEDFFDDIDPTKYGVDIDDYMGIKGVLTIERIKDIVGEIMSSCAKKMKYEILEYIMKGVIFEKKKLRESFMQEILNASDSAAFRPSLEKYINTQHLTVPVANGAQVEDPEGQKHERIIEYSEVDLNNACVEYVPNPKTISKIDEIKEVPETGFVHRLFMLTNLGIQVMQNLPVKFRCQNCPPQSFCPRGPQQDFVLRYEEIDTVIIVPQMPQKIIIRYTLDHTDSEDELRGQVKFQLTLLIPTFTKSAKIYSSLYSILQTVQASQENPRTMLPSQTLKKDPNLAYSDMIVQFNLRMLFWQINSQISKERINNLQLIFATLIRTSMVSPDFLKKNVNIGPEKDSSATAPFAPLGTAKRFSGDEERLCVQNRVIVIIVGGFLIVFKENWANWRFLESHFHVKQYKKQYEYPRPVPGENEPDKGEFNADMSAGELQQMMEEYCASKTCELFELVLVLHNDNINNLDIHKGKDPTVEVKCFNSKQSLQMQFSGDFERQKFVEGILECHRNNGEDEDDEEEEQQNDGDDDSDEDSDDAEEGKSESEEDWVDVIIYD